MSVQDRDYDKLLKDNERLGEENLKLIQKVLTSHDDTIQELIVFLAGRGADCRCGNADLSALAAEFRTLKKGKN